MCSAPCQAEHDAAEHDGDMRTVPDPAILPQPGHIALHAAALDGRTVELRRLLRQHPELVDERNADGKTALHIVSEQGHLDCLSALIEHGADVNTTTADNSTPVWLATYNFHVFIQQEEMLPQVFRTVVVWLQLIFLTAV